MSGINYYTVQTALYNALAEDAALGAMVQGVFDYVPARTAYPYLRVSGMRVSDISTQTSQMAQVEIEVHVYSRERGSKEAQAILHRVHALLHDANPPMEGCVCVLMQVVSIEVLREEDGKTCHGRMRVTVMVQEETV